MVWCVTGGEGGGGGLLLRGVRWWCVRACVRVCVCAFMHKREWQSGMWGWRGTMCGRACDVQVYMEWKGRQRGCRGECRGEGGKVAAAWAALNPPSATHTCARTSGMAARATIGALVMCPTNAAGARSTATESRACSTALLLRAARAIAPPWEWHMSATCFACCALCWST